MDWPMVANAPTVAAAASAASAASASSVGLRPPVGHLRSASCDWNEAGPDSLDRPARQRPNQRAPPRRRESSSDLSSAEENYFDALPLQRRKRQPQVERAFGASPPPQRCGSVPPDIGLSTSSSPSAAHAHSPKLATVAAAPGASALHRPPFASSAAEVDFRATPFGRQQHQNASPVTANHHHHLPQRSGWKHKANKWHWLWHRKAGDCEVNSSSSGRAAAKESEEGERSRDSSTSSCKSGPPPRPSPAATAMGVKRNFRANPHISCPDISSASSDSEIGVVGDGGTPSPTLPFKVSISSIFQRPSQRSQRLPRNSSLRYQNRSSAATAATAAAAAPLPTFDLGYPLAAGSRPPRLGTGEGCGGGQDSPKPRLTRKRTLTGTQLGGLRVRAAEKGSTSDEFVAPLARYKEWREPLSCG